MFLGTDAGGTEGILSLQTSDELYMPLVVADRHSLIKFKNLADQMCQAYGTSYRVVRFLPDAEVYRPS